MKGFTLIEILVVFLVCTLFMLLPTLTINKWRQVVEVDQFLASFEKKMVFTQQMAVVNAVDTQIIFLEKNQHINFLIPKNEQIVEDEILEIPASLEISGSDKLTFKKGSGNISKLSKFSFSWKDKKQLIEFQFQLGSGRYIKKIKQF